MTPAIGAGGGGIADGRGHVGPFGSGLRHGCTGRRGGPSGLVGLLSGVMASLPPTTATYATMYD